MSSSDIGATDMFAHTEHVTPAAPVPKRGVKPVTVSDTRVGMGFGRGPVAPDARRFRYDRVRGMSSRPVGFVVSRADRMDPQEAGDLLHALHKVFGIDHEDESRLLAFDSALFLQHTLNGASVMQGGTGNITVDGTEFELAQIIKVIGPEKQRRFFRSFADDIASVNKGVVDNYDPYDPVSADQYGQIMALAVRRGLQKFPHLVHDSADACLHISITERRAVLASKFLSIPEENMADAITPTARGVSRDKAESALHLG